MTAPRERVTTLAPPADASHAIVCAVWRTLDGPSSLPPVQATVPANVYACLNLMLRGSVRLGRCDGPALPDLFLTGPFARPQQTFASGPLHSLSVVLHPWVLHAWFGLDARASVDRCLDARTLPLLADPALMRLLRAAAADPNRWPDALHRLPPPGPACTAASALASALEHSAGVADAARHLGVGVRQFERRFVQHHGLAPRQWSGIRRFEASLLALARDETPLAAIAAQTGYADQPHMTRNFRRAAAAAPGGARTALREETPGYWAFRPARDLAGR